MSIEKKYLDKYAGVLVNFALGGGKGIRRNEVVLLQYDEPAKPLALRVYEFILKKGGHVILKSYSEEFSKIFYQKASEDQLSFFPRKYFKGIVSTIDHRIYLISNKDPLYLRLISPEKITLHKKSFLEYRKWLERKEDSGKFSWTLALYPTIGMAREAKLTLKEYWEQVIDGCFLKYKNPIEKWKKVYKQIEQIKKKLTLMQIKKIRIKSYKTDLIVKIGDKRKWVGGGGRNIPSFEIFTSPDWRGTEGHIFFDMPLYHHGNIIKNVYLEFKKGLVAKASADYNEGLLKAIIRQKGADKIGEISLTDVRFSHITKFMAHTLYDENFGGKYGNTHIALGASYHDAYLGDAKRLSTKKWDELGFNRSCEHCDIISTHERIVEAELKGNVVKVIYNKKGRFA